MWEFCISINSEQTEIIDFVFDNLNKYVQDYELIITKFQKQNKVDILLACNMYEKNRIILLLKDLLGECVCYHIKKQFLCKNLKLKIQDKITKQAFLSSLLFFDKDTDKYIVNKYLQIDKKIDLLGFFYFKLTTLREKWQELIEIANENEIYLYSDETFIELIKFLVDNIEIKSDVINIMSDKNSIDIFDAKFDKISSNVSRMNDESLVDALIEFCPKNINIYCGELLSVDLKNLICKLFEKRVRFMSKSC